MAYNPSESDQRLAALAFIRARGNKAQAARDLEWRVERLRACLSAEVGQQLVAEHAAELIDQYRVDADRIVGEVAAIGFSDIVEILSAGRTIEALQQLEAHQRAAIAEVTFDADGKIDKLKLHPKTPALQVLALYVGIAGAGRDAGLPSNRARLGGLTLQGPTEANRHVEETNELPTPERLD